MKQELIKIAQVTLKILSKKSWNYLSISEVKTVTYKFQTYTYSTQ